MAGQKADFGYMENPANGAGIVRARTALRIYCWELPQTMQAQDRLKRDDFQNAPFPGIYLLREGEKKIYVGEAKNVLNRLGQHSNNPPDQIANWDRCVIVNDGRPATLSDFNDNVIRLALEAHVNHLLRLNSFSVVSQSNPQALNYQQKHFFISLAEEVDFILLKKAIVHKVLDDPDKQVVFTDELLRLFQSKGKNVESLGSYEGIIDGEKYFIRSGSKKKAGYQITFRGLKQGSFIDSLLKDEGYLVVNRDGVPVVPLSTIREALIPDVSNFRQDTIDIWINFAEGRVSLRYKEINFDISDFRLISVVEEDENPNQGTAENGGEPASMFPLSSDGEEGE